jgi:putative FmdB family regulatory protein
MPIYEFRCKACQNRWESMRPMRDLNAPTPPCPSCESKETLRLLSVFASAVKAEAPTPCASGPACCRLNPGAGCGS